MKTQLNLLVLVATTFITLNANASLGIKSIELSDSTVINGTDVSAITLNNFDSSVESVEFSTGEMVKGVEVKKINLFKSKFGDKFVLMKSKHGGDSGD